jgi:hypothetical protein
MEYGQRSREARHRRTIESLQRLLDERYQYLLQTAKADWHRLFADEDPTDTCVSVHISTSAIADELSAAPRAGFLPARAKPTNGKVRRRLA